MPQEAAAGCPTHPRAPAAKLQRQASARSSAPPLLCRCTMAAAGLGAGSGRMGRAQGLPEALQAKTCARDTLDGRCGNAEPSISLSSSPAWGLKVPGNDVVRVCGALAQTVASLVARGQHRARVRRFLRRLQPCRPSSTLPSGTGLPCKGTRASTSPACSAAPDSHHGAACGCCKQLRGVVGQHTGMSRQKHRCTVAGRGATQGSASGSVELGQCGGGGAPARPPAQQRPAGWRAGRPGSGGSTSRAVCPRHGGCRVRGRSGLPTCLRLWCGGAAGSCRTAGIRRHNVTHRRSHLCRRGRLRRPKRLLQLAAHALRVGAGVWGGACQEAGEERPGDARRLEPHAAAASAPVLRTCRRAAFCASSRALRSRCRRDTFQMSSRLSTTGTPGCAWAQVGSRRGERVRVSGAWVQVAAHAEAWPHHPPTHPPSPPHLNVPCLAALRPLLALAVPPLHAAVRLGECGGRQRLPHSRLVAHARRGCGGSAVAGGCSAGRLSGGSRSLCRQCCPHRWRRRVGDMHRVGCAGQRLAVAGDVEAPVARRGCGVDTCKSAVGGGPQLYRRLGAIPSRQRRLQRQQVRQLLRQALPPAGREAGGEPQRRRA